MTKPSLDAAATFLAPTSSSYWSFLSGASNVLASSSVALPIGTFATYQNGANPVIVGFGSAINSRTMLTASSYCISLGPYQPFNWIVLTGSQFVFAKDEGGTSFQGSVWSSSNVKAFPKPRG